MKQIEINKFTDQVISMMDDIFDKKLINSNNPSNESNKDENKNSIINNLKEIIRNANAIFNNNCSLSDDKFIIYNFITKISLFISN